MSATDTSKRLVQDEEYYRYIFKKTERIVSVVFYILHNVPTNDRTAPHIEDIQHAARQVHDAVIQSLETRRYAAEDAVRQTAIGLIALLSKLQVAHAIGAVTSEVLTLMQGEIDTVLRGMNKYMKPDAGFGDEEPMFAPAVVPTREPRKRRSESSGDLSTSTERPNDQTASERRDRIKTILEAKGQASIKDIASIITDVSEKTIQRELNAMIEDNVIQRQGERRWSVYRVV